MGMAPHGYTGSSCPKINPLQCSLIGPLDLLDMARVLPSKLEKSFFSFCFSLAFNREHPRK